MDPTLILIIGGAFALILLVVGIIVTVSGQRSIVDERIGQYVDDEFVGSDEPTTSALTDWVNVRVERSSYGGKIARELAQADLKLKPGEYVALLVIASIGLGAIAWLLGGRSPVSAVMGLIVGPILPRVYVNRQKTQRLLRFNEQLPDMLNLMVNGLRAGFSTVQAMEAVSKELPAPISVEFRRVVQEMQLGIAMEQSLDNLYRRIASDDLDLIIAAINVQREVGGNLAEILDTISYTIRERVRIKGEIRVLTSQVLYSGRFLAMLPLILTAILWFVNRPYIMILFEPNTRVCGIIILAVAAIMVMLGYFLMTRIANIEV
ncbi:MAG: type II secretion system F family protein [Anaerolineales bacterium]|nr:type II secretion system F family protein [Anaerolineales bacterium]